MLRHLANYVFGERAGLGRRAYENRGPYVLYGVRERNSGMIGNSPIASSLNRLGVLLFERIKAWTSLMNQTLTVNQPDARARFSPGHAIVDHCGDDLVRNSNCRRPGP